MREGSLEAPVRHPIAWRDADFHDERKLDEELRRVFDVCHGCRRCFNLCDSVPRLFELIDEADTGELDSVDSKDFKAVVDACTLCDLCFMTKCPYVPPHEFNLDFPHLMLRYRAVELKKGMVGFMDRQLTETDRNGKLAGGMAGVANWASDTKNGPTRGLMQAVAGIDREAALPKFCGKSFTARATANPPRVNADAPAHGRKAVLYATCYGNYNNPEIGEAARSVLAYNGVETEVVYPECGGMPQLEHGDLERVAGKAGAVAAELKPWIDKGYDVIALVPSCALMLKFEWPLIAPENEDVKGLSQATFDVSEYIVSIASKEGLAPGLRPLDGGIAIHLACHARAQNMGAKAAEMMRLLPESDVAVIERCSGHGGSWGVMKGNFEVALKIGKPAARQAAKSEKKYVASECPLAGTHIMQGIERLGGAAPDIELAPHPIVLFARAYGLVDCNQGSLIMTRKTEITRDDIMDMADYGAIRKERRRQLIEKKQLRRLAIGPDATAHFEDYDSMWLQIHEMLYIEKGGEAQIEDELAANNPLIPKGRELVCTLLFEVDDPERRARFLAGLGGVEETMFVRVGGAEIMGRAEEDLDRTSAAGKASAVQFIHFPFTDAQVAAFREPGTEITVGFKHPGYAHMMALSGETREALAADFA